MLQHLIYNKDESVTAARPQPVLKTPSSLPSSTCLIRLPSRLSLFRLEGHTASPVHSMSAEYLCLSYSSSTVYSICATTALKLQSALGTQRGGPITAQATEAGSQLIGSCVSGTHRRRCQSQHFPSLFPRSPSPFPLSPSLPACQPTTDAAGLTSLQDTTPELICTLLDVCVC